MRVYAGGAADAAVYLKKIPVVNWREGPMAVTIAVFMRIASACAGRSMVTNFSVRRSGRFFQARGPVHIDARIKTTKESIDFMEFAELVFQDSINSMNSRNG